MHVIYLLQAEMAIWLFFRGVLVCVFPALRSRGKGQEGHRMRVTSLAVGGPSTFLFILLSEHLCNKPPDFEASPSPSARMASGSLRGMWA